MSDTQSAGSSAPESASPSVEAAAESSVEAKVEGAEVPASSEAAPVPEAAKPEPPKSSKKKFNLKVDGKEEEMEFDPSNEDELKKHLQLSKAAQKRMAEAAQLRKDVESFISALKADPFSVLQDKNIGIDVKELVNKYVEDQLKEAEKSPEQIAQEKLQKELETLRKEKEDLEKRRQEEELLRYQEAAAVQLDKDITTALNSSSSLPKSPYVVKRVADTMIMAMNAGYTNVSVKDVIPVVEAQIKEEIQGMFGAMPEEVMESVLGSANLERWHNKRIAGIKNPVAAAKDIKPTGAAPKVEDKAKPKMTMREFLRGK